MYKISNHQEHPTMCRRGSNLRAPPITASSFDTIEPRTSSSSPSLAPSMASFSAPTLTASTPRGGPNFTRTVDKKNSEPYFNSTFSTTFNPDFSFDSSARTHSTAPTTIPTQTQTQTQTPTQAQAQPQPQPRAQSQAHLQSQSQSQNPPQTSSMIVSSPTSAASLLKRRKSVAQVMSTPPQLLRSRKSSESTSSTNSSNSFESNNEQDTKLLSSSTSLIALDPLYDLNSNSTSTTSCSDYFNDEECEVDWMNVLLSEVVQPESVFCISEDTSIEKGSEYLNKYNYTSIPIKQSREPDEPLSSSNSAITTTTRGDKGIPLEACSPLCVRYAFDYSDLNAYLLLVLGHSTVDLDKLSEKNQKWLKCARSGLPVPVQFAINLQVKEPFETLGKDHTLAEAVQVLGRGVHRIMVTNSSADKSQSDTEESIDGILSQRRLVKYIWDNGRRFPSLRTLFQVTLQDLNIGNYDKVISIRGDALVVDALKLLNHEEISSLAVVDNDNNLLGNISVVDVKMLTKSTNVSLLKSTCLNFLNVLLSNRGLSQGKDSFPVFHVTKNTLLGGAIAKLVATQSHRLWIVDDEESDPVSRSLSTTSSSSTSSLSLSEASGTQRNRAKSITPRTSGKLIGVVSLTDIINRLGQLAGKRVDPHSARHQRRRSSIISVKNLAN